MGSSTIGFIDIKNIPSKVAFFASVQESISALVNETYIEQGVGALEHSSIPLIRNQAFMRHFNYDASGGFERLSGSFSVFVAKKDFSAANAYYKFKRRFGEDTDILEGNDAIPNEGRYLFISPDGMDYHEVFQGPKMVLSLGNWGLSFEIISRILNDFGAEYYIAKDDCSDEYEKIIPTAATV